MPLRFLSPSRPFRCCCLAAIGFLSFASVRAQQLVDPVTFAAFAGNNGAQPNGLTLGPDGNYYGTAEFGYADGTPGDANFTGNGVIFYLTPAGQLGILRDLNADEGEDGANPEGGLLLGDDDFLYGTNTATPFEGDGDVFRVSTKGNYQVLHLFNGDRSDGLDGRFPWGSLVAGSDGGYYGVTFAGGVNDTGLVYRLTPDGDYERIYFFPSADEDIDGYGYRPGPNLIEAEPGVFYLATQTGGDHGLGAILRLDVDAQAVSVVTSLDSDLFGSDSPSYTKAITFARGDDGLIYGAANGGGDNGQGVVFRIDPTDDTVTLLAPGFFDDSTGAPEAPLTLASDGYLYGTTSNDTSRSGGAVYRLNPATGGLELLANLDPVVAQEPFGPLLEAAPGLFLGASQGGGTTADGLSGTIFEFELPQKPTVSITATQPLAVEDGDAASYTISRLGGNLSRPLNVYYSVGGSATNGDDYTTASGRALTGFTKIKAGQTSATVQIFAFEDGLAEGTETIKLKLLPDPRGVYLRSSARKAILQVTDSDIGD